MAILRIPVIIILFLISLTSSTLAKDKAQTPYVPPEGKILLLIGQDKDTMENYVQEVGIVPAGFMAYTSIQAMDGLESPSEDRGAGVHHAQYFVDKYPHAVFNLGLYLVGALDGVLAGKYDENIDQLGLWIYKVNRPIYLRIGYEFDLPENNYDPAKYQAAFRYIVDRLRANGVYNVAYVWHSHGFLNPGKPLLEWYPGDNYVDWFAVSFFDPYNQGSLKIISRLARDHHKPVMIAESSPYGLETVKGRRLWDRWYKRLFDLSRLENVKMICYINSDWESQPMFQGKPWDDARVQQDPFIKKAWVAEIQKEKYLNSSEEFFGELE